MIPCIESGIPGFDELTRTKTFTGGIPENSSTLVYGPAKTGKSIFSNQFTYQGLLNDEPCLYITTNQGIEQFKTNMKDFQQPIEEFLENKTLYIIDTMSDILNEKTEQTENVLSSQINNPTDIMVKVGSRVHHISQNNPRFRSVLNSGTSLLAYNEDMLVVRVIKAYIMRINEAGGTPLITYTEDSADMIVETMLKAMVDNIVRLDGETLTVEAMKGVGKKSSPYKITEKGIVL
jgi:KaiC/GvpD/RAD55 family RecA-like ATPase